MELNPIYIKYTEEKFKRLSCNNQRKVFMKTFHEARVRGNLDAEEQLSLLLDTIQNHPKNYKYAFKGLLEMNLRNYSLDERYEDCAFIRDFKSYLTDNGYFNDAVYF